MYIALIIILFVFLIAHNRAQTQHVLLQKNNLSMKKNNVSLATLLFPVTLIWFMLCFKSLSVGADTLVYKSFYENTVDSYFNGDREWGIFNQYLYYFTFKTLKDFGFSFRATCILIYSCAIIPIYFLLKQYTRNPVQALLFFVCMGAFGMYASALRQIMAATVGYFAMQNQIRENTAKRNFVSLIIILCAMLIHNTAIIMLIPWFLTFVLKTNRRVMLAGAVFAILSLVVPISLIMRISQYVIGDTYFAEFGVSSNVFLIAVYVCMMIAIIWGYRNQTQKNREDCVLLIYAFSSIILMIFSSKLYILSRLSFYFLLPLCMVFSNAIDIISKEDKIGKIIRFLAIGMFILFFVVSLRDNTLKTSDYRFMWQDA